MVLFFECHRFKRWWIIAIMIRLPRAYFSRIYFTSGMRSRCATIFWWINFFNGRRLTSCAKNPLILNLIGALVGLIQNVVVIRLRSIIGFVLVSAISWHLWLFTSICIDCGWFTRVDLASLRKWLLECSICSTADLWRLLVKSLILEIKCSFQTCFFWRSNERK